MYESRILRGLHRLVLPLCFFAASVDTLNAFVGFKVVNGGASTIYLRGTGGDYSSSQVLARTAGTTESDWVNQSRAAGYSYTFLVECPQGTVVGSLAVTLCTYSGGYACSHNSSCESPGGTVSTNYSKTICITNNLGSPMYPNVTAHYANGTVAPIGQADPANPLNILNPGAYRCYTHTNSMYFYLTYGDTLFTGDAPETTVQPVTNITANGQETPNANTSIGTTGGPVVGNPAGGPSSGTNAIGGSSSLTQLDLNRAADAIIHSQAQNTARLVAGLESIRQAITNNSGAGDTFDDSASLMTNIVNANTAESVTASNAMPGSIVYGSNLLYSAGLKGNMEYFGTGMGGVTSTLNTINSGYLGSTPADWGNFEVTGPTTNFIIPLGSAVKLEQLNAHFGAGWRTWFKALLLWLFLIAAFMWYSDQLTNALIALGGTSQFQVSALAGGALSLVPGTNAGLRVLLIIACVSAMAFLPAIAVTMGTTLLAAVGVSQADVSSGALVTANTHPTAIQYAGRALKEWFPLIESGVIFANTILARFLLNQATGFLCMLLKVVGL